MQRGIFFNFFMETESHYANLRLLEHPSPTPSYKRLCMCLTTIVIQRSRLYLRLALLKIGREH